MEEPIEITPDFLAFGSAFPDGRFVASGGDFPDFSFKEVYAEVQRLGRPLTDEEFERFVTKDDV